MTYRRITREDRLQIKAYLDAGLSDSVIADKLGFHRTSISREINRNKGGRGYRPLQAQRKAEERQSWRAEPRKLTDEMRARVTITGINKTFSLPRVNSAEMLEEAYEGKEIDADEYFSNSMGIYSAEEPVEVKLKFFPPVAQYVSERSWHKSQRVVNRENGEIEMTLEVGITPELVQWVLGFGVNIEVFGPIELIQKILLISHEVYEKHEGKTIKSITKMEKKHGSGT